MAVIDVRNFKKTFGNKTVHQDVTFSVEKGECLGLVGGSGIGKSVVLRSLIGLEKADGGHIFIEGEDITKFSERQLVPIRAKAAYVFQNGALFDSLSVYDNLAYPLREHTDLSEKEIRSKIMDMLEEFGLQGADRLQPAQLSGGMQKRVGLARAIVSGPRIVLYDEPTAGLDPYNTIKIREMVLRLKKKGVTSVFVTHDMPTAFAVCDRFCLLQEGVVKANLKAHEVEKGGDGPLQRFVNGEVG